MVASPHKVYGTSSNDLVLQLRKRRIEKIILAGPAGKICVEAHLRDFLEQGFEVAMVRDATAGARNEEGDGYRAALVNFRASRMPSGRSGDGQLHRSRIPWGLKAPTGGPIGVRASSTRLPAHKWTQEPVPFPGGAFQREEGGS